MNTLVLLKCWLYCVTVLIVLEAKRGVEVLVLVLFLVQ